MEITLLHQTGPLLMYPKWRLLYYTRPVNVPDVNYPTTPTPANLPQMEITLVHHPTNLLQMVITLLQHLCLFSTDEYYPTIPPLLMYPRWRFPYYTTQAPC